MPDLIKPPAPKVHPKSLPPWRVLLEMTRNSIGIWSEQAFDDLFTRRRSFGIESVLLSEPEAVRHVLASANRYGRPPPFYRITRPLTGAGVLLAEGPEWRRQRKMLAPLFTPASLGPLLPHFAAAGENMVRGLEASTSANLSRAFQKAALDAVLRGLFSTPTSTQAAQLAILARRYMAGPGRTTPLDGIARREEDFAFANRGRDRFAKQRAVVTQELVAARREDANGSAHRDLLNLLLAARDAETGEPLSDQEIGDQAATFLLAGFETTSRLLFWATYLLTLDHAEQSRIRSEVQNFPPSKVTSLEDLLHWPRLRLTLLEALRLYPPAPNILRLALDDDVAGGQHIPKGAYVWISPWVMHRHRRLWINPTAFQPDRFENQPSPWTANGAFLPFGGGPRVCIGASFAMAEAQLILATLISQFEVTLDAARPELPRATISTAPSYEPSFNLTSIARPPMPIAA